MKTTVIATAAVSLLFLGACGSSEEPTDQGAAPSPQVSTAAPADTPQPEETAKSDEETAVPGGSKAKAKVIDTAFVPNELVIKRGTKVTWTQIGDQPHSVTAVDESFDSSPKCSPLNSDVCDFEGDTYSFTFKEAGTFDYYCRIHGLPTGRGMTGSVVVE